MLGLAIYVAVYGLGNLVGSDAYWALPQADERMALIGYRYLLAEPWQWPPLTSHAIDAPYAASVAYWDCIPLWALANKALATVVPGWGPVSATAYLGLWHGLAYALQASLGVACVRALGHRSAPAAALAALCLVCVPAFGFRYAHAALSAHWVELWALYLYLRTPAGAPAPRRVRAAQLAQLAIAALITPYHPVMSLAVYAAAIARRGELRAAAGWLAAGLAVVGAATGFAGYFAGEGAVAQWGFAQQGMNLLSWLLPVRSGVLGEVSGALRPLGTPWQWEGYCYLGLGFLALLVACAPYARGLRGVVDRHRALAAVALACAAFALSNHIYLGTYELASYRIPRALGWLAGQFRAPGRFAWLPMYIAMLGLLHAGLVHYGRGRRWLVLAAVAALQLLDARGEWREQRRRTAARPSPIDRTAWRALIATHAELELAPSHACLAGEDVAAVSDAAGAIQLLASERARRINGSYSTRTRRVCADEARGWPTLVLRPGVLHVFLPQAHAVADRLAAAGAPCRALDLARVCSWTLPAALPAQSPNR